MHNLAATAAARQFVAFPSLVLDFESLYWFWADASFEHGREEKPQLSDVAQKNACGFYEPTNLKQFMMYGMMPPLILARRGASLKGRIILKCRGDLY